MDTFALRLFFACVVVKNPNSPNLSPMADNTITQGGIRGLGSPSYICGPISLLSFLYFSMLLDFWYNVSLTIFCHKILQLKGVLHPWALFLKILCIFSKNKATSDKVSYGFGQKCSKELKNHSFTSTETIVVKLQ